MSSFVFRVIIVLLLVVAPQSRAEQNGGETADTSSGSKPFSHETVIEMARKLSTEPYREPQIAPQSLKQLDYSEYRQINYKQHAAIWGNSLTKFTIQLFAPGYLYEKLVDIDVVENGRTRPVVVTESSFTVPDIELGQILARVGKYAGFRLHYPINNDDYRDEFIVFQGASYFRAVSKGQLYGISTRGLSIDTAQPTGEEFALFKRFWIERPAVVQNAVVVHALLDSKSVSGAYRFGIYPGSPTWVDVDVILFPRRDLDHVGLAPLTSMFMHGPLDPADVADYRPAVHDSEALAMTRGNGERLWRPLHNPRELQISSFVDENPQGFGLIQRNREFAHYQDLEAKYHRRPSVWVKPLGNWGKGFVELLEIPSDSETNDNIVAYWRPEQVLKKGEPFSYSYRLSWPNDTPRLPDSSRIVRSAGGKKLFSTTREMVVDFSGIGTDEIPAISIDSRISTGRIVAARLEANPHINGARVFLSFDPQGAEMAELRMQLRKDDQPVAATWLYRWQEK
jgi:periplasmic glucans biosynthesis protein